MLRTFLSLSRTWRPFTQAYGDGFSRFVPNASAALVQAVTQVSSPRRRFQRPPKRAFIATLRSSIAASCLAPSSLQASVGQTVYVDPSNLAGANHWLLNTISAASGVPVEIYTISARVPSPANANARPAPPSAPPSSLTSRCCSRRCCLFPKSTAPRLAAERRPRRRAPEIRLHLQQLVLRLRRELSRAGEPPTGPCAATPFRPGVLKRHARRHEAARRLGKAIRPGPHPSIDAASAAFRAVDLSL